MASSPSPRNWEYNVFTSFHGPDVRKKLLSHLRKQFSYNGITMFDDNGIERSQIIAPALTKAIGESRIAIVLLSKNYASSSWCLDELLEILKCKEELGQIVMTVFYEVDPSDVRKQTGEFGSVFNKTCDRKTEDESARNAEEKRRKWSEALTYVGNIAGEDFKNWVNEAEMIEKIARDVSTRINDTPCRDFDGMVGLDDHLREMESLLDLDNVGVKIVGISGPAGIGKSTIARALHSRLSSKFQHSCFVDNLRESCKISLDEYGLRLRLHEHLLSKILNLNGMLISHLGVIEERLHDKKVLIVLDDVESLDQLEALAYIRWFGPGSRLIVTTENIEILQQHGINDIYHVGFPSRSKGLMIFCLSAFRQTFPPNGFKDRSLLSIFPDEVASICGNLPLGLRILGSSLLGKSQAEWIDKLPRLKNCLDGKIESVLKLGYESLNEKDQSLFLYIAVFFNYELADHVKLMLAKTNLYVSDGLNVLANKCLIHIDRESKVVMHRLLQVMAREVISKQEPWRSQILVDAQEISYVLEDATGNGSTKGVSFDVAEIDELMISPRAFERMCSLLFLKVYNVGCHTGKRKLHIPEDIEFPRRIRLFHWDAYPGNSLPLKFCAENLVKLDMKDSELKKLWGGTQRLANLKKMYLNGSSRLKELPDLSNATNLEALSLNFCSALVEIPSSIANLHKLVDLDMNYCDSLEVIPTFINLASLEEIKMRRCFPLRTFPDIPTNITSISIGGTKIEEFPASLRHCSRLEYVDMSDSANLKTFSTHLPMSVSNVSLSNGGIERITDCFKGLHNLHSLDLLGCKRLVSLPELPGSLESLVADDCESLQRVRGHLNTPKAKLSFTNCFKLDRKARQSIIQQPFVPLCGWAVIPGREVPAEFDHRARGTSLTIPPSAFNRFKVCLVIAFKHHQGFQIMLTKVSYRCIVMDNFENSVEMEFVLSEVSKFQTEHLFIFHSFIDPSEVNKKIVLEFSSRHPNLDIIECGVQILSDETEGINNRGFGDKDDSSEEEEEDDDDNVANRRSNSVSGETVDKEDDEEDNKFESGEESKDKDNNIVDDSDYESISMRRPRKKWILCLLFFVFFCSFAFVKILDLL